MIRVRVTPAKAGVQTLRSWIPAFAGMTIVVFVFFSACATRPAKVLKGAKPADPGPNFITTVYEVVQNAEEDGISATEIYVDGAHAGRTETGRKSVNKIWSAKLAPGNHLVRFERWILPGVGPWTKAEDNSQPVERFFIIREGERTNVKLKYYDQGRRYSYDISHEPLATL